MEDVREKVKQLKEDISGLQPTASHLELVNLFNRLIDLGKQAVLLGEKSEFVLN